MTRDLATRPENPVSTPRPVRPPDPLPVLAAGSTISGSIVGLWPIVVALAVFVTVWKVAALVAGNAPAPSHGEATSATGLPVSRWRR